MLSAEQYPGYEVPWPMGIGTAAPWPIAPAQHFCVHVSFMCSICAIPLAFCGVPFLQVLEVLREAGNFVRELPKQVEKSVGTEAAVGRETDRRGRWLKFRSWSACIPILSMCVFVFDTCM